MNNMPSPSDLLDTIPPATQAWILLGIGAVLLVLVYRKGKQAYRAYVAPRSLEDVLTIVAAAIATGVSAQGMWRFAGDVLGLDGPLRFLLFAFIEVAIVTSAVRACRNMREKFSAGVDGLAVWTLTCLTAVLSSMDAGSFAEAIFRLAAPLVAAWLWERGMAVERYRITGLAGINWAITPEKFLVRIGVAEAKDRTTTEVDVHRRLTRVALAAVRVRELTEAGASTRKQAAAHTKLRTALEKAEEHTDLATNPGTQSMLLDKVTTLRSGTGLVQLPDVLPWAGLDHPAVARTELPPVPAPVELEPVRSVRRSLVFRTAPHTEPVRTVRIARTFAFTAGPAVRTIRRTFAFAAAPRTPGLPARTETAPVPVPVPVPNLADNETFVKTITAEILASDGDQWGPDYPALMARTGRSKSWCEKRMREVRTALFRTEVTA